jgi:hypothetical protein
MANYAFANVLWLKKPMSTPDLPREYVITECYAAMEPSDSLWHRHLEKMEQLKERDQSSEEQY